MRFRRSSNLLAGLLFVSLLLNFIFAIKLTRLRNSTPGLVVPIQVGPAEDRAVTFQGEAGIEGATPHPAGFVFDDFITAFHGGATPEELLDDFLRWVDSEPSKALEWAENETEGNTRMLLLEEGLAKWATNSPGDAAIWVRDMGIDFNQEMGYSAVFDSWGKSAPDTAVEFFASLSSHMQAVVAETFVRSWAENKPADSTRWALAYDNARGDGASFMASVSIWAESDLDEARTFVENLDSERLEVIAHQILAVQWAATDSEAAAAWANSRSDPALRIQAMGAVMDEWAQRKPSKAASYVSSLDDMPTAERSALILANHWGSSDIIAAEAWVRLLPQGSMRDSAVEGLVASQFSSNPRRALEWSTSIGDPSLREELSVDVFENWRELAPDVAGQWLESASVPPFLRQLLIPTNQGSD